MLRLAPAAKYIRILATAIVLTATGYLLLSHPTPSRVDSSARTLDVTPATFDIVAQARLEQLQSRYKEEEVHSEVGLKIGNPGWTEYVQELQDVYERYFHPRDTQKNTPSTDGSLVQEIHDMLADSLKLSARDSPVGQRHSIPHIIHTTSKKQEFPEQFSSWRRMNTEDGWKVQYYDNDGIWRWMLDIFGRGSHKEAKMPGTDDKTGARILEEYEQLPTGVLRADFFRYLVLLMKGGPPGVYTDTDTACVRPLRDWPGIREDHWEITTKTDSILSFLPHVYDLLSVASAQNTWHHNTESSPMGNVRDRMAELSTFEPPRLVVALEYDHWASGSQGWREMGLSRGMQFVQWTMMAQPGHPVFLDTLNRIMGDVERHRVLQRRDSVIDTEGDEDGEDRQDRVLDVSTNTLHHLLSSDAVFRYLLARWGVHPRDISGASGGQRIGDVL
ncbi:hypothetical protein QFC22_005560 [Naganishia vaughanmartiniae]|uniref:Uncharacterized protein n=1 Tax=Naganishia vaughanmartiniae TaxID=1424756 RepID=A0ACC2WSE2_9TREE|nr:hypothetical protein QFC22_005560 [Naganishia vaughanmartiniae]